MTFIKNTIEFAKVTLMAVGFVVFSIWVFLSFFVFAGTMDNAMAEAAAGILLGVGQLYIVFLPNMAYWAMGNERSISLRLWTFLTTKFPKLHRFDYMG